MTRRQPQRWQRFLRLLPEAVDWRPAGGATCPEPEELLRGWLTAAPGRRDPRLEQHLTGCLECADEVDRLQELWASSDEPPRATPIGTERPASLVERARALVSFEMPLSYPVTARGAGAAPSTEAGAEAMAAYRDKSYATARSLLGAIRERGESTPVLDFHLGVCLMDANRLDEAIPVLEDAVRGRPQLGEYRWYLVQALLLNGAVAEGRRELTRVAALPGPYRRQARELARRLRSLAEGIPQG